jgi:alanine-glyoxylate transaminase/serine-glyoxylate transaminase/serine-pyruvate transaminase
VPGPVNIHEKVRRAMAVPSYNHRDPWFASFFIKVLEDSKVIYNTSDVAPSSKITPFIFPGTGTGGWESALSNTLSPGDRIVTFTYGQFSKLWVDMMKALQLDVTVIECPWGEGANEEKLAEVLKADTGGKIKAVAVVHNETATGVTSDLPRIRETLDAAGHDALFMVDGVSSIGALPFEMDKWGVDIAVTGSQKALSLPTGLALMAVSEKALAMRKSAKLPRMYYDWDWQLGMNPSGNVPYTPSIPLLYGLRASLDLLLDEGIANVVTRHQRLAEGTRRAVAGWGLDLLCKEKRWKSDSLTVVEVPSSINADDVVVNAYARYNLSLGVGLAKVSGKVFRIGHLGNMDEVGMLSAIAGAEMALLDAGFTDFTPGAGVGEAVKYWQSTSKVIRSRELA